MPLTEDEQRNACAWLLSNAGPSIRYRTLTEIEHRAPDDGEVLEAYAEIVGGRRLGEMTSKQNPDGTFGAKLYFHGSDTTEVYLRELFELGVRPEHPVLKKGLEHTERLLRTGTDGTSWIVGIFTEPLGRAGRNQLVIDWYKEYTAKFGVFLEHHRQDWLTEKMGYQATPYLEIPYMYVIRTLAYSWQWLRAAVHADVTQILEFLLVDMADVGSLYWISPKNPKVSYPNFFHIVSSDTLTRRPIGVLDFVVALECLWLLAEFGVVEAYPNVLNSFRFVSGRKNSDGLWEYPIGGVTKAKAAWNSYHGFALEESWRNKESPIAELTFRLCLIAEKNRNGTTRGDCHAEV
jgi:hypothetical protein